MLEELYGKIQHGKSFAFETTLSGRTYQKLIQDCRRQGYHVLLVFLSLPSADMAIARVAARVAQGGHNVPETDIRRRFEAGLRNFRESYKSIVDALILYDNSGNIPKIVERGEN